MKLKRTNNEIETYIYEDPKEIKEIVFLDRTNTEYKVHKRKIEEFELGVNKTYKDFIAQNLNPNIDEKGVFGNARVFQPVNKTRANMISNLENANQKLKKMITKQQEENKEEGGNENVEQQTSSAPKSDAAQI